MIQVAAHTSDQSVLFTLFRGLLVIDTLKELQKNSFKATEQFRTYSIRIYPKEPFVMFPELTSKVPCLRLELYGCTAPGKLSDYMLFVCNQINSVIVFPRVSDFALISVFLHNRYAIKYANHSNLWSYTFLSIQ